MRYVIEKKLSLEFFFWKCLFWYINELVTVKNWDFISENLKISLIIFFLSKSTSKKNFDSMALVCFHFCIYLGIFFRP